MLDPKTLSVALILILIIGCALHFVNWRMHRQSAGAKWWTIGLCLQTLGAVSSVFTNSSDAPVAILIALNNVFALGGTVLLVYGTASFAERPLPRAIYAGLAGFILVGTVWFTMVEPSVTMRLVMFGMVQFACNALILTRLGHIARRDGAMGVIVLATSMVSLVVLMVTLLGWHLLTQPEITSLYGESAVLAPTMLTLIACKTTMIFGYLLLSTGYSQAQLQKLALSDSLTGLPNRRAFEQAVMQRLNSARKQDRLTALAIFDVDHFKQVNDNFGHDTGDAVLQHLSRVAVNAVRPHDFIARVGGEEFAVIFEVEDAAELVIAANRLRLAIEINRPTAGGNEIPVTISVGAVLAASDPALAFNGLYRAADQALYSAKTSGRNRVVVGEIDAIGLAA
ncbi:diguanylate cyclase [Maricaulis sp.]|uniref:GGDEF domain-containing protein n=1 Tax=Maricaulis sp. TaxID=1486257 RepID=UPI003A8EC764